MARGRRTSLTIHLTAKERRTLLAWQYSKTIPAGHARRGRVILLVAQRVPISQLADTVGVSRRFVYKWVQRFLQDGLQVWATNQVVAIGACRPCLLCGSSAT